MKAADTAAPLWIRLFGQFEARVGGQPLPRLRFRKSQVILALLVLRHGREYSRSGGMERECLAGLLWPESAPPAALHNLRNCLTDLRRALGPEAGRLCSSSSRSLCLDITRASVDVLTFDAALAREPHEPDSGSALDDAVSVYRGSLLEGWTEEWVLQERQAREQAYLTAREKLAAYAVARGEPAAAERHLRAVIVVDPLREQAQRSLMELLAAGGNYAGALRAYQELRQHLHRALNAAPDPESQSLFQRLRAEARARVVANLPQHHAGHPPSVEAAIAASKGTERRAHMVSEERPAALRHLNGDVSHQLGESHAPAARVPEVRRAGAVRHNLPLQLTRFIGRQAQMATVQRQLAAYRLVTLTGAGGCGKTRLALEVATRSQAAFPGGVWFVELAPLADPALVPQAIAAVLDVREQPDQTVIRTLVAALKPRQLLLVLDNCEHLAAACAQLAETLLQSCPYLRFLTTSREPLGIAGEREYRIPSLSLPSLVGGGWLIVDGLEKDQPDVAGTISQLPTTTNQSEAVRLFAERAAAAQPAFALTSENAAAVAQICCRLDGIPLALELAAARLKTLPVETLSQRLDDMLGLLTTGRRTALPRHQTLRALIDWSFELLTPAEQVLLRRLSVFAGGCSLEAVEAICGEEGVRCWVFGAGGDLPNTQLRTSNAPILDLLTRLVDKSLVLYEERDGEGRYRMLEMIRAYAREQLVKSSEADALRERHAGFFLALAEMAEREFGRGDQGHCLDRLEREHGNLRAALAWSVESGELVLGLQLATALEELWYRRGLFKEALHHLLPLLAQPGAAAPTAIRARALSVAGRFTALQSDLTAARRLHEESLAVGRALGDRANIATAVLHLGWLAMYRWDATTARPLAEEALAIRRELGDPRGIAGALALLADVRRREGDLAAERALAEESLAIWRALGDRAEIGAALGYLSQVISRHGDQDTARPLIEEALATARELNDKVGIAQGITNLGYVAHWQEDYPTAQALFEQSLPLWQELDHKNGQIECLFHLGFCHQQQGDSAAAYARFAEMLGVFRAYGADVSAALALLGDAAADLGRWEEAAVRCAESLRSFDLRERSDRHNIAWALTPLARVALARGRPARAARLLGAAPSFWGASHAHWWPNQRTDYERIVSAVRAQLGGDEFATAWADGGALPIEAVIAEALQEAPTG